MTPNLKLKLWVHLWGDPLKKVCGIWPRSWFSSKKHDFWFSWTNFRTRFEARGHVPRGCSAHQMKGLGPLMCLATKILKIGPKLRELWLWQSKYPEPRIEVTISGLIYSLWLVTSMRGSGYFDCQSHNSLNFGPIFKILVAKHISVPRPFIWCAELPCGTWPRAQKRVLKLVHEN